MRKIVIANTLKGMTKEPNLAELRAMTLAFEHTMRSFNPEEHTALAYNMKQTKTKMSKEKISERIQKHTDMIKRRKERIKELERKKKLSKNPDSVQKMSQIATKHGDKIKKHQEAIKYYKMLGAIKPPKVNPATHNKPVKVAPTASGKKK